MKIHRLELEYHKDASLWQRWDARDAIWEIDADAVRFNDDEQFDIFLMLNPNILDLTTRLTLLQAEGIIKSWRIYVSEWKLISSSDRR